MNSCVGTLLEGVGGSRESFVGSCLSSIGWGSGWRKISLRVGDTMCMSLSCFGLVVAECDNIGISTSTLGIVISITPVGSFGCMRTAFSQHSSSSLVRSRSDMLYWVSVSSSLDK